MSDMPERYLGDAVIASFDGYQIWLRTDDGNNQRIALEPNVYAALVQYVADIKRHYAEQREKSA
jgi:hypothetical protein